MAFEFIIFREKKDLAAELHKTLRKILHKESKGTNHYQISSPWFWIKQTLPGDQCCAALLLIQFLVSS